MSVERKRDRIVFKFHDGKMEVDALATLMDIAARQGRLLAALQPNIERDAKRRADYAKPRGRRDRNLQLAAWLDKKFAAGRNIENRTLLKALPAKLRWATPAILKKEATAARGRAGLIRA